MEQLSEILKTANLRLTEPRKAVFSALHGSDIPLTASDIVRDCPGVNRASIYRIIDTFLSLSIITPIYVGQKPYYELAEPFLPHHHHLVCKNCKEAMPLQDAELEQFILRLGQKYHFDIANHYVEFEGYCDNCTKSKN